MPTTFEAVRELLIQAGAEGASPSDLLKEIRQDPSVPRRRGTYNSFRTQFRALIQLGWVAPTGERAPALVHGEDTGVLVPRAFYAITTEGLAVSPSDWRTPQQILYPYYADPAYRQLQHPPTGRPRGRPPREGLLVATDTVPPRRGQARLATEEVQDRLRALRPAVEALRTGATPQAISDVERQHQEILDFLLEAVGRAGPAVAARLEDVARQQESAAVGFEIMRETVGTRRRMRFLQGLEVVLTCCGAP